MEIDHIFICAQPGAPEAEALVRFGLVEGSGNTHPGQGTANRRFFFDNAFIELLWLVNAAEADSATTRPTLCQREATDLSTRVGLFSGSRSGGTLRPAATREANAGHGRAHARSPQEPRARVSSTPLRRHRDLCRSARRSLPTGPLNSRSTSAPAPGTLAVRRSVRWAYGHRGDGLLSAKFGEQRSAHWARSRCSLIRAI
jgi:hypothetical protein